MRFFCLLIFLLLVACDDNTFANGSKTTDDSKIAKETDGSKTADDSKESDGSKTADNSKETDDSKTEEVDFFQYLLEEESIRSIKTELQKEEAQQALIDRYSGRKTKLVGTVHQVKSERDKNGNIKGYKVSLSHVFVKGKKIPFRVGSRFGGGYFYAQTSDKNKVLSFSNGATVSLKGRLKLIWKKNEFTKSHYFSNWLEIDESYAGFKKEFIPFEKVEYFTPQILDSEINQAKYMRRVIGTNCTWSSNLITPQKFKGQIPVENFEYSNFGRYKYILKFSEYMVSFKYGEKLDKDLVRSIAKENSHITLDGNILELTLRLYVNDINTYLRFRNLKISFKHKGKRRYFVLYHDSSPVEVRGPIIKKELSENGVYDNPKIYIYNDTIYHDDRYLTLEETAKVIENSIGNVHIYNSGKSSYRIKSQIVKACRKLSKKYSLHVISQSEFSPPTEPTKIDKKTDAENNSSIIIVKDPKIYASHDKFYYNNKHLTENEFRQMLRYSTGDIEFYVVATTVTNQFYNKIPAICNKLGKRCSINKISESEFTPPVSPTSQEKIQSEPDYEGELLTIIAWFKIYKNDVGRTVSYPKTLNDDYLYHIAPNADKAKKMLNSYKYYYSFPKTMFSIEKSPYVGILYPKKFSGKKMPCVMISAYGNGPMNFEYVAKKKFKSIRSQIQKYLSEQKENK